MPPRRLCRINPLRVPPTLLLNKPPLVVLHQNITQILILNLYARITNSLLELLARWCLCDI